MLVTIEGNIGSGKSTLVKKTTRKIFQKNGISWMSQSTNG